LAEKFTERSMRNPRRRLLRAVLFSEKSAPTAQG
jgi:hypothetical protein